MHGIPFEMLRDTPCHMSAFYELECLDSVNQVVKFDQFKNKVVLVVNVASQCGFTKQYTELQNLYEKYKDQGLVIIGFPCNQFGSQEPGTDSEIQNFCKLNFGVTFPVMKKVEVNGSQASPVYQYLKSQKSGMLGFSGIKWNFEKFLVNRKGDVTNRWASTTPPKALEASIVRELENNDS